MLMDLVSHPSQNWNILLIPKTDISCVVRGVMKIALLSKHDPPATLCFDAAHGGHCCGVISPHTVALGRLVEAVSGRNWPYFYRFKQNVEARISHSQAPKNLSM